MHYLTFNVGFAPLESKQTLTYTETNVSETGGISESFVYYFGNKLYIFLWYFCNLLGKILSFNIIFVISPSLGEDSKTGQIS